MASAVFLQQLHYRIQQKVAAPDRYADHFINDRFWVYWTGDDLLREIPLGRSIEPHRRVVKDLRTIGVLIVEKHRAAIWDRTNFYTIDYPQLDAFIDAQESPSSIVVNDPHREQPNTLIDEGQSPDSMTVKYHDLQLTKTTTETTSKTTTTTGSGDLIFDEFTKPHQATLERAVSPLQPQLAQRVLDEASGTLRAISRRERKAIGSIAYWIASVVEHAQRGDLIVQYGDQVAATRNRQQTQAKAHEQALQDKQANKSVQAQRLAQAAAYLLRSTLATRTAIVSEIPSNTLPAHIRAQAAAEIESGLMPANPIVQVMTLNIIEKVHATEATNDSDL